MNISNRLRVWMNSAYLLPLAINVGYGPTLHGKLIMLSITTLAGNMAVGTGIHGVASHLTKHSPEERNGSDVLAL